MLRFFSHRHFAVKIIAGVFALILLIILALVFFSEPLIKSFTERKGGKSLDRDLVIEGPFAIDWHWRYLDVVAGNIRLSNAPDYPDDNMLNIEKLEFRLRYLALLRGRVEFDRIDVEQFNLNLQRKSATDANWNFPVFSEASLASAAVLADDRHEFPIIRQLSLKQGRVIYRDAVKGMSVDLALDSVIGGGKNENGAEGKIEIGHKSPPKLLDAENSDEPKVKKERVVDNTNGHMTTAEKAATSEKTAKYDDGSSLRDKDSKAGFTIKGTGIMQKQKFTVEASGGALESLRESSRDYPLDVHLTMGATDIRVIGTFKDPIKLTGVNASLKITGHNMADLFYFTAIPLPPTPAYAIEGQLTKNGTVWGYQKFKGKVGGSDLGGNFFYDLGGERGFLKGDVFSKVIDAADLGGFIGLPPSVEKAAPEQKVAALANSASSKLIPDVALKLERLRATDLDVVFEAQKIEAPSLPFKGMKAHFDLKDGLLQLNLIKVVLADGTIDGVVEIDANQNIPPMKMALNLRKLSLAQFFNNTRFATTTAGYFGGKVNLAGVGVSLADVLASSNGSITLLMAEGKISQLLIEASDLDLAQALPLFLGKDKPTRIRCGVTDFDVVNGILSSKVVVLDTDDSLLVGSVNIDLKREVINAKLDAKPKDGSIFAAQIPITLTGPLKTPAIGLDSKKAGNRGGAAVALGVLLTPFAAILPFIEQGDAENADCRALLSHAGQ